MATMEISSQNFRQAMGQWATGIAIVTTHNGDQRVGTTINSFTSVSLDPPLVSFCLGRLGQAFPHFAAASGFAINVLSTAQEGLVLPFAQRGQDETRWQGLDVSASAAGHPLIDGALAHLDCVREYLFEAGDHAIFVGRVVQLTAQTGVPLIRYGGQTGTFLQKV